MRSRGDLHPLRPTRLGLRRDIPERQRERFADVRSVVYMRRLTGGQHLVRNQGNSQPYRVSALAGAAFVPGQFVLVGSHAGHTLPGETILSGPPPGQKNAVGSGALTSRRSLGLGPSAFPADSYLAISRLDTGDISRAYEYKNGAFVKELNFIDHAAEGILLQDLEGCKRDPAPGVDRIVASTSGDQHVIWNITTNAVTKVTLSIPSSPTLGAHWIQAGRVYYVADVSAVQNDIYSYSLTAPADGPHTLEASILNTAFTPNATSVGNATIIGSDGSFYAELTTTSVRDWGKHPSTRLGGTLLSGHDPDLSNVMANNPLSGLFLWFDDSVGSDKMVARVDSNGDEVALTPDAWVWTTGPTAEGLDMSPNRSAWVLFRSSFNGDTSDFVRGTAAAVSTGAFASTTVVSAPPFVGFGDAPQFFLPRGP